MSDPHFFVCVRTRMQQQQPERELLPPPPVLLPSSHFRARGKFESLGIWQREKEERRRMEGEEKERPLRSGTGVAVCGALAGTLTQRDQCVWLPHEEEDDINPLFLSEEPPLPRWYIPRYSGMNRWDCVEMGMIKDI